MRILIWACKQIDLPEIDEIFTLVFIQECLEKGMSEEDIMKIFHYEPNDLPKQFWRPWLLYEDEKLLNLVKNGQNWKEISKHFTGHNEIDCWDRYVKLTNEHTKGIWSEDETHILKKYYE